MPKTFFQDRRTGAIYTTQELHLPTEGRIPVKPAYKSDTVWLDRAYADRVEDPHLMSPARLTGLFLVLLLATGGWLFASWQVHTQLHVSFYTATWMELGWTLFFLPLALKVFGLARV
jgi:hypothetical protein